MATVSALWTLNATPAHVLYFHAIGGITKRHAKTQFTLLCCLALFLCATIYGLVRYPAGPIHKKSDGIYRDKSGRTFTETQFHAFQIWEGCFAGSFGLVVIAAIADASAKKARKSDG